MKQHENVNPRLSLVGAGPGDPELITLKAIRTLQAAQVVLYDALVSNEILAMIPSGVPSFCVGKRAGEHSYSQEKINELLVTFAYQYGHVVRLKGGDPFVFGRGSEEMNHAEANGVPTFIVQGVSSALSVPASLGIPVTARGVSESVWIVTGTTRLGHISADMHLAAKSTATLVVLMGLAKLNEIVQLFLDEEKGDVPIAIIQNGTLKDQKCVVGTMSSIIEMTRKKAMGSPAILVIGEVVKFASAFHRLTEEVESMTG